MCGGCALGERLMWCTGCGRTSLVHTLATIHICWPSADPRRSEGRSCSDAQPRRAACRERWSAAERRTPALATQPVEVDTGRPTPTGRPRCLRGRGPGDPAIAQALQRRHPNAVFAEETAASLTFWPDLRPTAISVRNLRLQGTVSGILVSRRTVPADLVCVVRGLRVTVPELTALDLSVRTEGDSIDRLLRSRMGTLAALSAILGMTPHRRGNADRRRILLDSWDEPWSRAERLARRILRSAASTTAIG